MAEQQPAGPTKAFYRGVSGRMGCALKLCSLPLSSLWLLFMLLPSSCNESPGE